MAFAIENALKKKPMVVKIEREREREQGKHFNEL
jgi:hypothetical protein